MTTPRALHSDPQWTTGMKMKVLELMLKPSLVRFLLLHHNSIICRQVARQTVQEVCDAPVRIWEDIHQDTIRHLKEHTDMWGPYKLQSIILSCCSYISAN